MTPEELVERAARELRDAVMWSETHPLSELPEEEKTQLAIDLDEISQTVERLRQKLRELGVPD